MSKTSGTVEQLPDDSNPELTADQVASYLESHPEFFINQQELLADLTLPHESGDAVSLMERQVRILRDRGLDARIKLNTLLNNARDNDQLFEVTREIVLALLRSRDVSEIIQVAEDKLRSQNNIDACEIILAENKIANIPDSVRTEPESVLKEDYADVFRLRRTYCGMLSDEQLDHLFSSGKSNIKSTAICPVIINNEIYGLLAIGNQLENYFNVNLDTLFLDFIGNVVGAVLNKEIGNS
jgi:uncharacterized protein YigA (DUF484 family)